MVYRKIVKRVDPKSSHQKENFLVFIASIWDDRSWLNYCGYHFTIFVNQTSYCTTQAYTVICQLFLNKLEMKIYLNISIDNYPSQSWSTTNKIINNSFFSFFANQYYTVWYTTNCLFMYLPVDRYFSCFKLF